MGLFADKPVLDGEIVRLVPVTEDDVDALAPLMRDPEVAILTGSVHHSHPTPAELEPHSAAELRTIYRSWSTAEDRIVWTVRERAAGAVVGEVVLNDLDAANHSCGFRIWTSGARGRGVGTEATRLAVRHAFACGLHRVELEVFDFNPRARHVYEKAGFRWEGTRRRALRFDDGWVDAHTMAILADDWPG